jgi:hypothetical protein
VKQSALTKSFDKKAINEWLKSGEELEQFLKSLPVWVQRILELMEQSISKAVGFPAEGKVTPKMMGIFAGQLVASSKAVIPKTPTEKSAPPYVKKAIRQARGFMKGIRPVLRHLDDGLMKHADTLPLAEESAFYQAKAETLRRNSKGISFWEDSPTRVYIALLLLAPAMPRIRSVRELHTILCGIMGKSVVGDLKRVEAVCRRIKLKFRAPGRPKMTGAKNTTARRSEPPRGKS